MVENGAPGPRSDRAAGFFAGIKVFVSLVASVLV